MPTQQNLAAGRVDGTQDTARRGGLAASALAHQTQRLALIEGKTEVIDRTDMAHHAAQKPLLNREKLR